MSFFQQNNLYVNNPQPSFVQNNFYNAPTQDPNALQGAYTQGCEDMQNQMLKQENCDLKSQLAQQQQQGGHNKSMFNMMNPMAMLGGGGGGGGGILGG